MHKNLPIEMPALLRQLSEGDDRAFRYIYDRYWKSVYRTALRFLRSDDVAQDIVQDVFGAVWEKRTSFLLVANLESYLVVMTQHHAYRQLRKWASDNGNFELYRSAMPEAVSNDTENLLLSKQYEALLAEAVNALPPQQKQVFLLSREEGLSHEDIADRLHISQGTVKNHMVRALGAIRNHLAPHIATCMAASLAHLLHH